MFTFPTLILILNICIFVVGILLLTTILPYRKRPEIRWLIVLTVAFSIISFCSLNVYIQESLHNKTFFSRLRFLGLGIIAQSWFFFLVLIYSRNQFFRKSWVTALAITPSLITIVFAIVPKWNHFITTNYEIFRWQGANIVSYAGGEWFPIHIILANIFAFSAVLFLLYMIPRSTGVKRVQMIVLLVSSSTSLLIDTYAVLTNSPLRFAMLSGGTFLVTEAAILYAIRQHGLLDLSPIAKNLIFSEIPDPVIILDDQNRVLDFNTAAKHAFQLSDQDLNHAWKDLKFVGKISPEKPTLHWTHIFNNEECSFNVNVVWLDAKKNSAGKIIFFRDISLQKRIESRLNSDLNLKAHLLSIIAHDFSSILQTQSTLSSHLKDNVPFELRDQAQALTTTSLASQDLMSNILNWAKLRENKMEIILRPFEINNLIKEVINTLEGALTIKKLKIDFTPVEFPLIMNGDSVMIESVFRNILTNAIRASFPGQTILVNLKKDLDKVIIEFQDKGLGMNQKKLSVLKNLENLILTDSENPPEGFGIGLTIAKKFIDLHQGSLNFESQEGQGTLVTLSLPLKKPGR